MANLLKKTLTLLQSKFEKKEEKDHRDDEKEKRIWESLSKDILGEIIRKLSLRDALSMSRTCMLGRSALQNNVRNIVIFPWMMLPYERETNCVRFFDLSGGFLYKFNLPKKLGRVNWFFGSSKGWLIIANGPQRNPRSFLFNPISGIHIQLPPLTTIPSFQTYLTYQSELKVSRDIDHFFVKLELSSTDSTDVIVAGIMFPYDKLAICRPKDKSWTIWDYDTYLRDILYSNGILHALIHTELHFLETHPLRVGDEDVILKILSVPYPDVQQNNEIEFELGLTSVCGGFVSYLVESKGEILLVQKMLEHTATQIDYYDDYDTTCLFIYDSLVDFMC